MSRMRRKLCDMGITKEYVKGFDYAVEDSINNFFDTLDAYDFTIDGKSVDIGKYLSDNPDGLEKFKEVLKEYFDEERQRLLASLENNYCNSRYDYKEVDD